MNYKNLFVKDIHIEKVRHLKDIDIKLSDTERKNLIFTGKNGSGKTSVLEAIKSYISIYSEKNATYCMNLLNDIKKYKNLIENINISDEKSKIELLKYNENLKYSEKEYNLFYKGLIVNFNSPFDVITSFQEGNFILAYYEADRNYKEVKNNTEKAIHIEKIELQDNYTIETKPGKEFVKYLRDLKTTQALAESAKKNERAEQIKSWFITFENFMKEIFEDKDLKIEFDIETYEFSIIQTGREPFDFDTMSSGFSAILDIVADLMMRMEKKKAKFYDIQGLVLIDEIETHLHIELQKTILPFLTKIFPNIQFIVTTHSPFILSSAENSIIYDLEKDILVKNGLEKLSYTGIVEGYFEVDSLSKELREKFEKYKELLNKENLTNKDYTEIDKLEIYLDEMPDYLVLEISPEYQRLKLEFEHRGD